ncbi:SAICAR synthase-like protein [Lentinula raphanica]|uniref:1-phosphatidylinositol-4-phosphate 5-kinase n=1 Tax=Lentinula raphanica TaxID=153919 RepID=A0AA38P5U2_9AGAR|nr:SAICAR synthase-like protein [Lentinula raphanica]KAJ3973193.1 SAICAR synthase-like protein [Lentinula raphanica]
MATVAAPTSPMPIPTPATISSSYGASHVNPIPISDGKPTSSRSHSQTPPSSSPAFEPSLQRYGLSSNRNSGVSSSAASSAASFRTAPLQSASTTDSRTSSRGRDSPDSFNTLHLREDPNENHRENRPVNPLHILSTSMNSAPPFPHQEIHVVKVTSDRVHVETGPMNDSLARRVAQKVPGLACIDTGRREEREQETKGPPPPSPPASDEATGEENASSERTPNKSNVSTRTELPNTRASTETKASMQTIKSESPPTPTTSSKQPPITVPQGEYLQPPPITSHNIRPHRRNTTGSVIPSNNVAPTRTIRTSLTSQHNQHATQFHSHSYANYLHDDTMSSDDVEDDIQAHAEKIRRERQEKRAKQAEAEAALTKEAGLRRDATISGPRKDENYPLVGNLIGEDHVNYVLMYNMLTGIRIGVSRCQAKIKRPLTDEDFIAKHKFSFDIVGNELTPSAKYDFKFKDYAPWVFRSLREDYFHLDPADYLLSLTSKYILSELGSPGKSGSFFYFSRDYRFIIKTIHHREHKFLLRVLKDYYNHVSTNPHTLISRFYGLHRVKLPRGRKIHFVIMNNLFPPHKDIHETYDLKGSTVGRLWRAKNPEADEKSQTETTNSEKERRKEKKKSNPVLKDLNWINGHHKLELGPEKRALLTEQLRRDKEFLKAISVMDYSLLVGIHNMQRGNRDNVRRKTLKVFEPSIPKELARSVSAVGTHGYGGIGASTGALGMSKSMSSHHPHNVGKGGGYTTTPEAIAMRRAMRSSDPKALSLPSNSSVLPDSLNPKPNGPGSYGDAGGARGADNRLNFIFYQDEGGLRATDEENRDLATIYYLGVIDILTPWGTGKRVENFWKGLSADRHKISPVPPSEYAERFFKFMKAIMKGGEGDPQDFV